MSGLVSALAGHIESLLEVKYALGPPHTTSERHLHAFEAFSAVRYPGQASIGRQMAMAWAASRPGEHANAQMCRITPVRQLAQHMTGLGRPVPGQPVAVGQSSEDTIRSWIRDSASGSRVELSAGCDLLDVCGLGPCWVDSAVDVVAHLGLFVGLFGQGRRHQVLLGGAAALPRPTGQGPLDKPLLDLMS